MQSFEWVTIIPGIKGLPVHVTHAALVFLILPTLHVVLGAFRTAEGGFTLANLAGLMTGSILKALMLSLKLSLWTAALGCGIGLVVAAVVTRGGLPPALRDVVMTFSGVMTKPLPGSPCLPPTYRPTRSWAKAGTEATNCAIRRAWSLARAFIG